jgi:hypothetical protein
MDGKQIANDKFSCQIFKKPSKLNLSGEIALYDPKGLTSAMLKLSNIPYTLVNNIKDIKDKKYNLLTIGRQALGTTKNDFLAEVEGSGLFSSMNVLIFEQTECNLGNFVFENTSQRYVFIRQKNHPVLAGLTDCDFINWTRESDLIEPYPMPSDTTKDAPHYPYIKWKWGNKGIVSTCTIRKPNRGGYIPLLDCGFDLFDSPLLERNIGISKFMFCQLDVTNRYGKDPVATIITNNMLEYMTKSDLKANTSKTGFVGDEKGFKHLLDMGFDVDSIELRDKIKKDIIIVGENAIVTEEQGQKLDEYVKSGGTVIVLKQQEEIAWLPFITTIPKGMFKVELSRNLALTKDSDKSGKKETPLFRGLGLSSFYWRNKQSMLIIKEGEEKEKSQEFIPLTFPNIFTEIKRGAGKFIFCQISYNNNDPLVRDKIHHLLNTILVNAGVVVSDNKFKIFDNTLYMDNTKSAGKEILLEGKYKFSIDINDEGLKNAWEKEYHNNWKELDVPNAWENQGITQKNPNITHPAGSYGANLTDENNGYDGYAYYQTKVVIPEDWKGNEIIFNAGVIDDFDWTYFNGKEIGRTTDKESQTPWSDIRNYKIPENLIEFGKENIITVRVWDKWNKGGITYGPVRLYVNLKKAMKSDTLSPYISGRFTYDINSAHNW